MGAHGGWGTLKRVGEKAEDSLPEPEEAPPTSIPIPPAPTIYKPTHQSHADTSFKLFAQLTER